MIVPYMLYTYDCLMSKWLSLKVRAPCLPFPATTWYCGINCRIEKKERVIGRRRRRRGRGRRTGRGEEGAKECAKGGGRAKAALICSNSITHEWPAGMNIFATTLRTGLVLGRAA